MREEAFSDGLYFYMYRIEHARGAAGRVSCRAPSNRSTGLYANDRRTLAVSGNRIPRLRCCHVRRLIV